MRLFPLVYTPVQELVRMLHRRALLLAFNATHKFNRAFASTSVMVHPPVDGLKVNLFCFECFHMKAFRELAWFSLDDGVFNIQLNRPKKYNALTLEMLAGIGTALDAASSSGLFLCLFPVFGAGDYFTAGNDFSRFTAALDESRAAFDKVADRTGAVVQRLVPALIDHRKPLIALINGPAVGFGVTFLPLCDYVLASDKATFLAPFTNIAICPELASTVSFPILVGQLKSAEMLLFSRKLNANEAREIGLVTRVVPHDKFEEEANAELKMMLRLPRETLELNKALLRDVHREALHKAVQRETDVLVERFKSQESFDAMTKWHNHQRAKK